MCSVLDRGQQVHTGGLCHNPNPFRVGVNMQGRNRASRSERLPELGVGRARDKRGLGGRNTSSSGFPATRSLAEQRAWAWAASTVREAEREWSLLSFSPNRTGMIRRRDWMDSKDPGLSSLLPTRCDLEQVSPSSGLSLCGCDRVRGPPGRQAPRGLVLRRLDCEGGAAERLCEVVTDRHAPSIRWAKAVRIVTLSSSRNLRLTEAAS